MVRDPSFYVSGLLDLHKLRDANERRATWRQSMAALARATADEGVAPLDGIHPEALLLGVKAALASGLADDLDWLAPSAAGAALYELASALPLGPEQREIGRRVMARLIAGNAEVFVVLATRMALGAGKGLGQPPTRSRVALVTEIPLTVGIADGPLALALTSRRELAREWIALNSVGSLPARRLAARLIERAAREAARRAAGGDDHAVRAFRSDAISSAFRRLLADREPLVWRHVAVARGLLSPWVPEMKKEIDGAFDRELTPTEWRRGATSLAALIALNPTAALRDVRAVLATDILARNPGIATAFVWGVPRAAESEPDAASELLTMVLPSAPFDVAAAIVELRSEFGTAPFIERATETALKSLSGAGRLPQRDDGAAALLREVLRDLENQPREDQPLSTQLDAAIMVFANAGAREAYSVARNILDAARGAMDSLHAVSKEDETEEGRGGSIARRTSFGVLRDLDVSLLERNVLSDLLHLGGTPESSRAHDESLDVIRQSLAEWILERESQPLETPRDDAPKTPDGRRRPVIPSHPTLRIHRLRTLLHLVDSDVGDAREEGPRVARMRQRWQRTAKALVTRFERDPPSVLRRTVVASLARALDALVRVGACDVTDALLVLGRNVEDPDEFDTLREASMDPDLVHVLSRYAVFLRACKDSPELPGKLVALEELSRELSQDASARTEAVRTALVRLHTALVAVASAPSLRALAGHGGGNDPDAVIALETSLATLVHLAAGARGRLDPERASVPPTALTTSRPLSVAVSRVLSGAQATLSDHTISACVDEIIAGAPKALAALASVVMWSLGELPIDRPSAQGDNTLLKAPEQLPTWLPTRRTIGGFYIVRALGVGAVGSVFLVTRLEDKNDADAEKLALKVPEYSATAARSVSESEFLQMFRAEASALMLVPPHPNLARFVTFDVGAKPKPILVMEFVEGVTLEKTIESRALDMPRAIRALDEVLAGLQAMHAVEVGHLDIKPSNVLLRNAGEAVVVDFGLAGRHIRPGCTTGPYGAPEVWGVVPDGLKSPTPMAADVYAFGCLAYETLTGKTLFHADSEMAQVALHVSHDGDPAAVRALGRRPQLAGLVDLLHGALRRDPRARPSVDGLRKSLNAIKTQLLAEKWPLASS